MASRSLVRHRARTGLHSGALKRPRGSRRLRRASATCNSQHCLGTGRSLPTTCLKYSVCLLSPFCSGLGVQCPLSTASGCRSEKKVGAAWVMLKGRWHTIITPLWSRAVSGLEQNTSERRQAVYKRARKALRNKSATTGLLFPTPTESMRCSPFSTRSEKSNWKSQRLKRNRRTARRGVRSSKD